MAVTLAFGALVAVGWVVAELTAWPVTVLAGIAGVLACTGALFTRLQYRSRQLREAAEREVFHMHLLSYVADAIVATDEAGRITIWNGGAESLFGAAAADAIGQRMADVIAHRRIASREGDLRLTLEQGGEWNGDGEIVGPRGETVFVDATLRNIHRNGARRGQLLVVHSVDARHRAELDARTRARQQAAIASLGQRALAGIDFELLVNQAVSVVNSTLQTFATAVLHVTEDGRCLRWSAGEGWSATAGRADVVPIDPNRFPDSVLSAEAPVVQGAVAHPLLAGNAIVASAAVPITGAPRRYGLLVVADRRRRSFSRDDLHFLQSIANVIGSSYDRSRAERELRASIALQRATLEATAEAIVVTDASGRVTGFNRRYLEMWNFPPELTSAEQFDDWVAWVKSQFADPEAGFAGYRAAVESNAPHVAIVNCADGRVVERHTQPQLLDGRTVGRVWCYRDLTALVNAQEHRLRFESQMQQTQKLESLGLLAGGIAHDFNNLLVSMLGNAGLALTEVPESSPVFERLVQLQTAAQRAAELTNQMLTYSGKGRLVVQTSDLSALVEEMVSLLRAAVAKNIQICLDVAPGLPAFEGDTSQIGQVIMNLITNASDAIGTASGRIDVSTGRVHVTRAYLSDACVGADLAEGEFVFAEVRDSGCGMDAVTLARIFDPFFTTKVTGRGLGLAAALGIIRSHRGAIKISSTPGRGTTFRVLLPACQAPALRSSAPAPAAAIPANARVLVVDDEDSVRAIARESLKRAGFEVATANDGASALGAVSDVEFDAVLLDMTMPGISGVDVFRGIKRMRPDLPIVVTSGYSRQQMAARFGSDDVDGFIQKPFLPAALVEAMRAAVNGPGSAEVA